VEVGCDSANIIRALKRRLGEGVSP